MLLNPAWCKEVRSKITTTLLTMNCFYGIFVGILLKPFMNCSWKQSFREWRVCRGVMTLTELLLSCEHILVVCTTDGFMFDWTQQRIGFWASRLFFRMENAPPPSPLGQAWGFQKKRHSSGCHGKGWMTSFGLGSQPRPPLSFPPFFRLFSLPQLLSSSQLKPLLTPAPLPSSPLLSPHNSSHLLPFLLKPLLPSSPPPTAKPVGVCQSQPLQRLELISAFICQRVRGERERRRGERKGEEKWERGSIRVRERKVEKK